MSDPKLVPWLREAIKALGNPPVNGALISALSDAYIRLQASERKAESEHRKALGESFPDFSHPDWSRPLVVYTIRNTATNRTYVGATGQGFTSRYRDGKWWEHTHNKALREEALLFGIRTFDVSVFPCDCTEQVRELEATMLRHGCRSLYNIRHEPSVLIPAKN